MSQIRTAKAVDIGAFPGSKFVVDDTPPIAQCQETKITAALCSITTGSPIITKAGAFVGIDLAGKEVVVTGTLDDNGTYGILSNTDNAITTDHNMQQSEFAVNITVQDIGQAYLTRNESSFIRYIENQSKAHTTKGGQLYTDLADPPMDDACTDTWNPE